MDGTDLHRAIDRAAAGAQAFCNGDPAGYARLWSRADDVTIFGGFGGVERGGDAVAERITWASKRFRDGEVRYEPITSGHSGDLAYAVGMERGRATVVGADEPGELNLRVTQVFRREDGEWRLVHRHADAVATVIPPAALLASSTPADGAG